MFSEREGRRRIVGGMMSEAIFGGKRPHKFVEAVVQACAGGKKDR